MLVGSRVSLCVCVMRARGWLWEGVPAGVFELCMRMTESCMAMSKETEEIAYLIQLYDIFI
jgi:hypothetical protein